jgi:hypothetical protein
MFEKIIKKVKAKVKESSDKKKEENEWKEEVMKEARSEARKEARNVLKDKMKEKEIKRLTADKGDKLKQFGEAFKTGGLASNDKMERILGRKEGSNTNKALSDGKSNNEDKINRILGQQKSKVQYGDVIKDNVTIMTSRDQERADKDERIKRMLR